METKLNNIDRKYHADGKIQESVTSSPGSSKSTVPMNLSDLDTNRYRRLTMITNLLTTGLTLTAEELTWRFAISRRTAYRDMREIRATGFPIKCDNGRYSCNFLLWETWIQSMADAWVNNNGNLEKE